MTRAQRREMVYSIIVDKPKSKRRPTVGKTRFVEDMRRLLEERGKKGCLGSCGCSSV